MNFLIQNQLFHPFSQENPLQSGTGLGLAIVNSIVRSESVNGHVDVSSTEGVGTEIRITFDAATSEDESMADIDKIDMHGKKLSVSLYGFDDDTKGTTLLRNVIERYLKDWWGFEVLPQGTPYGDIIMINEESDLIGRVIERRETTKPIILLSSSRADAEVMGKVYDYERIGGFCRMISKPAGPSRLRQVLKASVHFLTFRESSSRTPVPINSPESIQTAPSYFLTPQVGPGPSTMSRRTSQESAGPVRPRMLPRAATFHPTLPTSQASSPGVVTTRLPSPDDCDHAKSTDNDKTINVGVGGTLLKTSVGTAERRDRIRVLVVEDNQILRDLLCV